jgi:hypothetical protein
MSHELGAPLEGNPHVCMSCIEHALTACPRCSGQRSAIKRYREGGLDDQSIVGRLGITRERLVALDAVTADKEEADGLQVRTVDLEKLQEMVRRRRSSDPGFTLSALSRAAGVAPSGGIDRILGLRGKSRPSKSAPSPVESDPLETEVEALADELAPEDEALADFELEQDPNLATKIDIEIAGKIARALGALPSDVDTL